MCFNISSKFTDLQNKWDSVSSGNLKPKGVSLASESISNILFSLKNVSADSFSLFPEKFKNKNIQLLDTLCKGIKKSGFTSVKIEKITSNALAIKKKIEHGPTSWNINEPAPIDLKMALFCDIDVENHNGATNLDLMTALRTNVPFITTRTILSGKNLKKNKHYLDELQSIILNKEDQWEIYQYKKPNNENKELIVFIPKSLTSTKSVEFKSSCSFWEISAKDSLKRAKYKSNNEAFFASINRVNALIGLFGEIEKSSQGMLLYMDGHGKTSSTAGLYQDRFERFLDGIKGVCRGLILKSCGASGKVSQVYFPKVVNESNVMQKDKDHPIASYNEKLEGLPFWVVLKSIGDFSTFADQEADANLFLFMEKLSILMQSPGGATIARYKRMLRDVEKGKKKRWTNWNKVLFPHSTNSPVGLQTACESEKAHPYLFAEEMRKPLERIMRAKIAIQKHLKEIESINQIEEGGVRIYHEWKALLQDPRTHDQDKGSFIDKCYNYTCRLFPRLKNWRQDRIEKKQEYIYKPAEFLLVDPLIVNETLNFQKSDPILLPMTPGQSQVFLKEIQLSNNTPFSYLRHMLHTYAKEKPYVNKGFFIGKLQYGKDQIYEQVVVNITPERRECIYQEGGDYYHYCPESDGLFHYTPSIKDKNKVIRRISPFEYLLLFRKWQKSTQCDANVVKRICGGQQNIEMFNETVYSKAFWGEEYGTLEKYQPVIEWMEKTKWELDYTTKWELKHTTKPSYLKIWPEDLKELTQLLIEIDPELLGDLVESSAINILIGHAHWEVFSVATNDMDKYGSLVKICLTKMAENGATDESGIWSPLSRVR